MQVSEPAEYVLLGLLAERPMHGYEMFQRIQNDVLKQVVHIEMSQLYAFLKKLESLVLIEADLERQGARPPRRVYRLTPQGRDAFQQWLAEPVERPRDIRILFLLKLYFVQRQHPTLLAALIDQEIAACQKFLHALEERRNGSYSIRDPATFEQVVLASRIYQTQALLVWLRELQTECVGMH